MNHEEALIYALAGGPAPQEARAHLESCPACAAELVALRGVEERLRASAPATRPVRASEVSLAPAANGGRRAWAAIAAACLCMAFAAAWWGIGAPGSGAAGTEAPSAQVASYAPTTGDESLASVLDAVQEDLEAAETNAAAAADEYFDDPAQGGVL